MISFKNNTFILDFDKPKVKKVQETISEDGIGSNMESNDSMPKPLVDDGLIPRNIFMLWFGDEPPTYTSRVLERYCELNPSFNVKFIHKTKNDILYSVDDPILNRSRKYIEQTINGVENKYIERIKEQIKQEFNYIQILADIYRFEILWEHGGIYVDCDTWPMKPFDDSYLSNNGFNTIVFSIMKQGSGNWKDVNSCVGTLDMGCAFEQGVNFHKCNDIYCFGLPMHFSDDVVQIGKSIRFLNTTMNVWFKNLEFNETFKQHRLNFLSNKMDELSKIDKLTYITSVLHFRESTWVKDLAANPMLCSFDHLLYPDKLSSKMIEKNLIFIWIGDKLPDYADIAIEAYRKMNPDFNIIFKHFTIHDIEHPIDKCLKMTVDAILEVKDGIVNEYYDYVKRYLDENRTFCQVVANLLRFVLLKEYGGIYLDLDTLPIKPFDDVLLKSGSFNSICAGFRNKKKFIELGKDSPDLYDGDYMEHKDDFEYKVYPDIFMIGLCKDYDTVKFTRYVNIQNDFNTGTYVRNIDQNDKDFLAMKKSFFNCKLKELDAKDDNKYILHFTDRTWMKNKEGKVRSPRCKYDYQETIEPPKYLDKERIEWMNGIISYETGSVEIITNPFEEQFNHFGTCKYTDEQRKNADEIHHKIHKAIQKIWRGIK